MSTQDFQDYISRHKYSKFIFDTKCGSYQSHYVFNQADFFSNPAAIKLKNKNGYVFFNNIRNIELIHTYEIGVLARVYCDKGEEYETFDLFIL